MAACECYYALGSDTGGSIRQPSSFLRSSGTETDVRYSFPLWTGGIWFFTGSDRPVAKDVADCAAILESDHSHDEKRQTSIERDDCDFTEALVEDVKGLRIGIFRIKFRI